MSGWHKDTEARLRAAAGQEPEEPHGGYRMERSVVDACCHLFEVAEDGKTPRWPMLTKAVFLRRLGLPDAIWLGGTHPLRGWMELEDQPSVEVRFRDWDTADDAGMPNRRKLRVGLVVLAAEELVHRMQRVPTELAAAAALALATGAVVVRRKGPQ